MFPSLCKLCIVSLATVAEMLRCNSTISVVDRVSIYMYIYSLLASYVSRCSTPIVTVLKGHHGNKFE